MRRKVHLVVYLLLFSFFLGILSLPAFAATRVVYYQGKLSDAVLMKILREVFPDDLIKIVRISPRSQPQPQPRPQPQPQPQPDLQGLTQDERAMFNLVNQERARAGLNPLAIDYQLVKLARLKSQDMVDKGYFGHYSPTYGSPFEMMDRAGVKYRYAGENLAGAPAVEAAHRALMNSPGHRANILNPEFTRIGIGVASGGPYGKMFTQMFTG